MSMQLKIDFISQCASAPPPPPPGTNDLVHDIFYSGLDIKYATGNAIDGADHKFTRASELFFNQFAGCDNVHRYKVWPELFIHCTTSWNETKAVQHSSKSKNNAPMRAVGLGLHEAQN